MTDLVVYTNYSRGVVVEYLKNGDTQCSSWLLLPAENLWPEWLRGCLYLIALLYLFVGIAIISDVFMCSIEIITSKKRTVVRWDEEKGERVEREILVWNETVANLTLMALGSSAPEILLSVCETVQRLDGNGTEDALGTFTIIGSAAFNLLMITAICIVSVPSPDAKKIREFGVFLVTAAWSMWAYIWMLVVLRWVTPGEITIWEAWVTLGYMPLLVFSAYAQDNGWWFHRICKRPSSAVGVDIQEGSQANVRIVNGGARPRASVFHGPSKELATLEAEKQYASSSNLKSIQEDIGNDMYLRDLESGTLQPNHRPKVIAPVEEKQSFARARFRHAAVRSMLGGKKKSLPPLNQKSTGPPRMAALVDKVRAMQNANADLPPASDDLCGKFTFASPSYSVFESAGTLDIDVLFHRRKPSKSKLRVSDVQNGNLDVLDEGGEDDLITGVVTVDFETRDGSAKRDTEYKFTQGKLVFKDTEWKKSLSIPIVNDNQYESDMDFYVILKNATGDSGLGDPSVCRVTIIDDDEPGEFSFEEPSYHANLNKGCLVANVVRSKGSDGTVTIQYTTIDGSAKGGDTLDEFDYKTTSGTLCFKHGEMSQEISVDINKACSKKLKNFVITLRNPSLGAKIGDHSACVATIGGDFVQDRIANILEDNEEENETYGEQFRNAMTVGGDKDDDGNDIPPSSVDYVLHFLTFFWKVLFAFVPPKTTLSGYPAFLLSLLLIGGLTALVEQLGHLLGCVIGIRTSVTGITIVALGTSLPDTFASRTAAMQDQYADASIGNVTGSNSVNVFLGLGLPWVINVMYKYAKNKKLYISTDNLDLSVTVFTSCGAVCILLLVLRRKLVGGELGGPKVFKWVCAVFLVFLWMGYIITCSLKAYTIF
ncbi:sodium/calcium exchanger 1-like [Glandiceps talaboti]